MRTINLQFSLLVGLAIVGFTTHTTAQSLPDTMYQSAKTIDYVVERFDTLTPAAVRSFTDRYDSAPGIFTFRGSSRRDMPQSGKLDTIPHKIEKVWSYTTAYDGRQTSTGVWGGGSGWTGQPVYVEWADNIIAQQRAESSALSEEFSGREIIVGSLSSDVYFIDFETGKNSRTAYKTGNPIKGSVSLDPRLNGNLYIGQGIPAVEPIGADVFNLFGHKRINFFERDPKAWRRWSAYDPSAVVVDNFVIRPSENGTIYKLTANSHDVKLHSTLRYRRRGMNAPGIESSPAVWKNYLYVTDNSGTVLCVNIDTMKPVWFFNNVDDTDATPIIIEEQGCPMLYVGSAVDKQGESGYCHFTKLNALTGEKIWQNRIPCHKIDYAGKLREGGMFSTPLVGRGDCEGLLFTNICGLGEHKGTFVAIERSTGAIKYRTKLDFYSWSSPVALYTEEGKMYIFTGDVIGNAYLIEASTGKILFKQKMAWNFESSPVVVGDCVVVGSRGNEIHKFRIK